MYGTREGAMAQQSESKDQEVKRSTEKRLRKLRVAGRQLGQKPNLT